MDQSRTSLFRRLLPWLVSAVALGYVFGYAIDWQAIPAASAGANLPLFITITVLDKLMFFAVWGLLQAVVIRRFVEPVPITRVLSIKGGSELLRTVNNSLGDAAFFLGVSQLVRGPVAAVIAVATIPFFCHFAVLLVQASLALPFVSQGIGNHRAVMVCVVVGWLAVVAGFVASRMGVFRRLFGSVGLSALSDRVRRRDLVPFLLWFVLFAIFDVLIQGAASRAFGIPIPWGDLAAGIPVLYMVISLPSLGNFGTREIAWANLFSDHGTREGLTAFALWTNTIFLVMHFLIGVLFLSRALHLLQDLRHARRAGEWIKAPLFRDPIDP